MRRLPPIVSLVLVVMLAACGGGREAEEVVETGYNPPLFPGETQEIRGLVNKWADHYDVPRSLVHRVIQRESDYRPLARNGPYWGMMQILPATARGMGHDGPAQELLDPDVNLEWAVKYLRGAWLLSYGDEATAVGWYARGYYYEARDRCMLIETGLREREVRRDCPSRLAEAGAG